MSNKVCVRSRYYSTGGKENLGTLDHAFSKRDGNTNSCNIHTEFTSNNIGEYYKNAINPQDAFNKMKIRHEAAIGKNSRSDFNGLYENIIVLSEKQYSKLEKRFGSTNAKKNILKRLKDYADFVTATLGFTWLATDLHLDEGHINSDKKFVRNVHAHIQFYNYDFDAKRSPLSHILKYSLNSVVEYRLQHSKNPLVGGLLGGLKNYNKQVAIKQTGSSETSTEEVKENRLTKANVHGVLVQDLAGIAFAKSGFKRGISKRITQLEHLSKNEFITQEVLMLQNLLNKAKETTIRKAKILEIKEQELAAKDKRFNSLLLEELRLEELRLEESIDKKDQELLSIHDNCTAIKQEEQKLSQAILNEQEKFTTAAALVNKLTGHVNSFERLLYKNVPFLKGEFIIDKFHAEAKEIREEFEQDKKDMRKKNSSSESVKNNNIVAEDKPQNSRRNPHSK